MKLILSRKSFGSAAGGVPSPILEDGTMLPLPIPSRYCPIRYETIELHGHNLGRVIEDPGARSRSPGAARTTRIRRSPEDNRARSFLSPFAISGDNFGNDEPYHPSPRSGERPTVLRLLW